MRQHSEVFVESVVDLSFQLYCKLFDIFSIALLAKFQISVQYSIKHGHFHAWLDNSGKILA